MTTEERLDQLRNLELRTTNASVKSSRLLATINESHLGVKKQVTDSRHLIDSTRELMKKYGTVR